ncbi:MULTISPECIES: glutamate racemase [unclassified Rothia (in: high G+C Gram-positive bacteria)]|uniref:glutamate racemase n=1 Tax=unclassified Rothia (in: high G+C Gram-positive bacteria) TaxID=2689056 RepID=UPI00195AD6BF|nr:MULTISPECIES: glutamate racemase [unclassified Rothia (in: high G+C Gram-positive bacteria)]MBM7050975.1 glutamate racemase [Rothia sp. ZJ1223]QRZ62294.1 glutamate racemase [Rothia sp. ZJ932]
MTYSAETVSSAWGSQIPARPTPSAPIGVFDSGVGGLTVARAIMDQLPHENIIYVGDTAHGPYGPLTIAQVRAHALRIMDELVDSGVKMLVIACNTASAAVLRDARERYTRSYGIPVVEVIQPAARRAVAATRNRKVGVIATEATVTSRAYEDTFAVASDIEVISVACPRFVEFVEKGITSGSELLETARQYLQPLKDAGVDTVVLGCTHYPLLTGVISYLMGDDVTLVSSSEESAKDVFRALVEHSMERSAELPTSHEFLATGETETFDRLVHRFLGSVDARVRHTESVAERFPTGSLAVVPAAPTVNVSPELSDQPKGSPADSTFPGHSSGTA